MNFIINKINELIKIFYPTKEYKQYIKFNRNKWKKINIHENQYKNGEILVDLFHHYPFINIWSNLVNLVSNKKKYWIKYFYFYFYSGYLNRFKFYSKKLRKIYNSFNVENEGIDERNLNFNIKNKKIIRIQKTITNKSKLKGLKYKGIKIGDLIYATYLRTKLKPTVNLQDKYLNKLVTRSINIFNYLSAYLKKNRVKLVIVSHPYYIQYGIITRIASKLKIPVVMIYSKNRGNNLFRLKFIDNKSPIEDFEYYNYTKKFSKLNSKKKRLSIGKKIIKNRFSGKFFEQLPYMHKNIYSKNYLIEKKKQNSSNNVYIFAHDFFDNPYRFRWMIFEDFFEQLKFLENIASKTPTLNWYLKPHPNTINQNYLIFEKFFSKSKYLKLIDKNIDNFEIINKRPKFIITNHGTVAHEFAYHNIPVINTGDNLHINYDFCLHAKSKKELKNFILDFEKYKSKINFDKKNIHEFSYMEYFYSKNKLNEFTLDNLKIWSSYIDDDKGLSFFIKQSKKNKKHLNRYLEKFTNNGLD